MMETVKERSEVSEEFKWAVTDIYKNDDCWNDDYNAVKAMTESLLHSGADFLNQLKQCLSILNSTMILVLSSTAL